MKIAIKFWDNDFYNCFTGVLQTLLAAHRWNKLPSNKEHLAKMINEISYGCYLLFQNQFEYNEEKSGEPNDKIREYLKIKPENILIDKEVDDYINDNRSFSNGETFILDLYIDYPGNNPIYTF